MKVMESKLLEKSLLPGSGDPSSMRKRLLVSLVMVASVVWTQDTGLSVRIVTDELISIFIFIEIFFLNIYQICPENVHTIKIQVTTISLSFIAYYKMKLSFLLFLTICGQEGLTNISPISLK